jgi:hypothetical protein
VDQKLASATNVNSRGSWEAESLSGRTETLIPKVREVFGDRFTLYADYIN